MKPEEIEAKDIHEWAVARMKGLKLPVPRKPKNTDPEFSLPDDPDALPSPEVGQLMMRFAAWFSYSVRLLGMADSELVLVESEYKLKVNSRGIKLREELGRVSAEVVEAAVLAEDGDITEIYQRRLELLAIKTHLEARTKIYERGYSAMSRELSRRETEARLS